MKHYAMFSVADISYVVDIKGAELVRAKWHSGAFGPFRTEVST